ncbi:uncharacterized protein BO97DRAFT_443850 [Aspergillus homomorphus CBS 101889]|uniref:Uncharacterized protein n=1 Tax=Aspergillus homomorphus (strain CBS 101889) TaxID=1450537 RepID=A0A395HUB1_ASPHC|nr:hypothetical protein BO97DRAFT_443850 [Aspergillus homomorphus CBS 101889]RAL11511.1 hypothetical protein BO97DRAFT_443850 [Aspergillus homomorphus CBS 101889]
MRPQGARSFTPWLDLTYRLFDNTTATTPSGRANPLGIGYVTQAREWRRVYLHPRFREEFRRLARAHAQKGFQDERVEKVVLKSLGGSVSARNDTFHYSAIVLHLGPKHHRVLKREAWRGSVPMSELREAETLKLQGQKPAAEQEVEEIEEVIQVDEALGWDFVGRVDQMDPLTVYRPLTSPEEEEEQKAFVAMKKKELDLKAREEKIREEKGDAAAYWFRKRRRSEWIDWREFKKQLKLKKEEGPEGQQGVEKRVVPVRRVETSKRPIKDRRGTVTSTVEHVEASTSPVKRVETSTPLIKHIPTSVPLRIRLINS